MKILRVFVIIVICIYISGCSKNRSYIDGDSLINNLNSAPATVPISNESEYIVTSPIEVSGKTIMRNNVHAYADNERISNVGVVVWEWEILLKNNFIITNNIFSIENKFQGEKKILKLDVNSKYNMNGEEIFTSIKEYNKYEKISVEDINSIKEEMSKYVKDRFSVYGKKLKTGDILRSTQIPNLEVVDKNKVNEIVKGTGVYKNKKVVITEISFDNSIDTSSDITIRGNGYNLYDYDTFTPVHGEHNYRAIIRTGDQDVDMNVEMIFDTPEFETKNVINDNFKDTKKSNEFSKSQWLESAEKIKALGVLLEKGLITQIEYDSKKNELLQSF
jgi:hypothetical protein